MNKAFLLVTLFVFTLALSSGVLSVSEDIECQIHGFDYGIVKHDGCGTDWNTTVEEYSISLDFDGCKNVHWEAEPGVDGVLSIEGTNTWVHAGGTSGDIESTTYVDDDGRTKTHDISHITFCGYNREIPEFGGLAAIAAVGLVGAALVALKRD